MENAGENGSLIQQAEIGSLDAEVVGDIRILMEFLEDRHAAFRRFFGRNVRLNPVVDEILRRSVLAFGTGKPAKLSEMQKQCAGLGSPTTIRGEIGGLEDWGLIVLVADTKDMRARKVYPTVRLVSFYNTEMPRLRAEAVRLLCPK